MNGNVTRYKPGHEFKNGCKWVIESHHQLVMAMEELKNPSVCPSSVHVTPGAAERQNQDLFYGFLYVIVRRECVLQVTTDHFKKPSLFTTEEDKTFITRILRQCSENVTKCSLEEFRGRLSVGDLRLLLFNLTSLGLALATSEDVLIAKTIMKDPIRMVKIRELHLSVATSLHAEDFKDLTQYCKARLCVYFFEMSDTNVEWLLEVVIALDKPFGDTYVGVDEIFLPGSKLTVKGTLELHRQLKKYQVKYPIALDAEAIPDVVKSELTRDFEKIGNQITFHTSRPPFVKWFFGYWKLMTMNHGPMVSRVTGTLHIYGVRMMETVLGTAQSTYNYFFKRVPEPRNLLMA